MSRLVCTVPLPYRTVPYRIVWYGIIYCIIPYVMAWNYSGNNFVDIWAEKEKVIFLDKLKEVFQGIHGAESGR